MSVRAEIHAALAEKFPGAAIEVLDESEQHRGHAGWREGGETHFRVQMRGAALAGMTRLARHRAVHAALGAGIIGRIHALALDLDG